MQPMTTTARRVAAVALPVLLQSLVAQSAVAGFNDPIGKLDVVYINHMQKMRATGIQNPY